MGPLISAGDHKGTSRPGGGFLKDEGNILALQVFSSQTRILVFLQFDGKIDKKLNFLTRKIF
jgi:hypothetical protein